MHSHSFFDFVFQPLTDLINFVLFHLRYKVVKNVEEFVRVARQKGVTSVVVDPLIEDSGGSYGPIGVIGDFRYMLEITAVVSHGQDVVYQEFSFKRFGSSGGFADTGDRDKAAMKLLLLGEKKMKELQSLLPDISVTLNGSNGPIDESFLAKLHRDAQSCGVSV